MAVGTTFKLSFDASNVRSGIDGVKNSVSSLAKVGAGIAGIAGSAVAIGAAVTAAAAAATGAVVALGVKINSIGEEAIASDNRLKNVTESMGLFGDEAGKVTERLLEFADTQGRLTGIDDDIIAGTQAKLMTFKELGKTADTVGGAFDRATMAAVDMAKMGFGQAETNAVQLGKALNNPIKGMTALARVGIEFTAEEKNAIKTMVEKNQMLKAQDAVLKVIEQQVEGTAIATAKASEKIKVSMSQVVEAFAKPFSQGFKELPGEMESVFPELIEKATALGVVVSNAIADSIRGNYDKLTALGEFIGTAIMVGIKSTLMTIGGWITETIGKNLADMQKYSPTMGGQTMAAAGRFLEGKGKDTNMKDALGYFTATSGLLNQGREVMSGRQGLSQGSNGEWRYANPGESTMFRDMNGNPVVKVLQQIEKNTSGGAKF